MNLLKRLVVKLFPRRRAIFLLLLLLTTLFISNACGQKSVVRPRSQPRETTEIRVPMQNHNGKFFNWKSVNLQGMGYVTGLIVNPVSPHDVYIRTDIGGAYKFDRENSLWLPLLDAFDTNMTGGSVGVESIAVDPNQLSHVYTVTNSGRSIVEDGGTKKYHYSGEVLASLDNGKTWKPTNLVKNDVYVGPNNEYRYDTGERLVVDPNQSGLLYFASRRDGLWKKDGDTSWTRVLGGLPDPNTLPNYQKPDGSKNDDLPGFTFVVFDKHTGTANQPTQTIYVGVHGSGVWQSTNGGTSWNNIGGANDPLRGVFAQNTLYVSFGTRPTNGNNASGSVRKLSNGSWTDITPDGADKVYSAVTVQLDQPDILMTISDRNVYRSTNGGAYWQKQVMYMGAKDANNPKDPVNSSAPPYYESFAATGAATIVIDPSNPKEVWWTNGWGVARTNDVTVENPFYQWLMHNLEELDVNVLRIPPKPKAEGGADLLSGTQDMIGFRHSDRSQVPSNKINPAGIPVNPAFKWANPTWDVYPQPFPHVAGASSMDYSYNNPDYAVFVGFHQWQGFWSVYGISSDNGQTWKAFESIPHENLWKSDKSGQEEVAAMAGQIAMSSTNPQSMVWIPTWGPWPHYTSDGGKTWNLAKNQDHDPKPNPYDPQNNDHTHYDVLPRSWANSISPWVSSHILAADRKDPDGKTFYYYDGWIFRYSTDGGANWEKGASGLPTWIVRPNIVPNPTKVGDIWMSFAHNNDQIERQKLYRSVDGGKTFDTISSVDSCEFVTFGKGHKEDEPYIYIFGRVKEATNDAVYKSEDMGKSWIQISDPSVSQFPGMSHLEGDMRTPNLVYAASAGRGITVGDK